MKIYARVEQASVTELFATDIDIAALFHRDVHWIDVTGVPGISCGWCYDGMHFSRPVSGPVTTDAAAHSAPEPVPAEGRPSETVVRGGSAHREASGA
jgi:hypothetical protein